MAAVALLSAGIWWVSFVTALGPIADRGRSDLALATDRLVSQLHRYRQVSVLLADHPAIIAAAEGQSAPVDVERVLLEASDKTGTLAARLFAADGTQLAASATSDGPPLGSAVFFRRAMQGAIGTFHAQVAETGQRVFHFAAPVQNGGPPVGVVVVSVDMEEVEESNWRGDPQTIYFVDDLGVIFVANRSELLLQARAGGEDAGFIASSSASYPQENLRPFFGYTAIRLGGQEFWRVDAGRYIPARALHLSLPVPVIGMTGEALVSTAPAERIATLQTIAAAAACLAFGAFLFVAAERRRALADKLAVEARANAVLETRVRERTAELSSANEALRHEVVERTAAETALKKAQADLVQAGKLSALGQMSAGISHELNQPLMAIQNYADNGTQFLNKGHPDRAGENLGRIGQMASRMARIIKNLRAFARNESEPMGCVDLVQVIEQAVELTETRLKRDGIMLDWTPPEAEVQALGGEVRLSQVFVNLITNAADAMADSPEKRIEITLDAGARLVVTVRDTGPGIDEPDKIFDPFYSTKAVGSSEGMGLGLSISYGLVQSFGGNIRGANSEGGGAIFTVELDYWQAEAAA